jgi:hypothetical protein
MSLDAYIIHKLDYIIPKGNKQGLKQDSYIIIPCKIFTKKSPSTICMHALLHARPNDLGGVF